MQVSTSRWQRFRRIHFKKGLHSDILLPLDLNLILYKDITLCHFATLPTSWLNCWPASFSRREKRCEWPLTTLPNLWLFYFAGESWYLFSFCEINACPSALWKFQVSVFGGNATVNGQWFKPCDPAQPCMNDMDAILIWPHIKWFAVLSFTQTLKMEIHPGWTVTPVYYRFKL